MKSVAWLIADNVRLGMSLATAVWQAGLEPEDAVEEHKVLLKDGGSVEHFNNKIKVKDSDGKVLSAFVG